VEDQLVELDQVISILHDQLAIVTLAADVRLVIIFLE
jgi:hypothetical protein